MYKWIVIVLFFGTTIPSVIPLYAQQWQLTNIQTEVVLYPRRERFKQYLHQMVKVNLSEPYHPDKEESYNQALDAVTQFMLNDTVTIHYLQQALNTYTLLPSGTQKALLEAILSTQSPAFVTTIQQLLQHEKQPKHLAMMAEYVLQNTTKPRITTIADLQKLLPQTTIDNGDSISLTYLLRQYLLEKRRVPLFLDSSQWCALFALQQQKNEKTIYSIQRHNRNFAGLAIIQNADGRFARDSTGALLVFQQLARSASNMPYFITNGNTPQGMFKVVGTAISHNQLIGPTPNIQMVMPFENDSLFFGTDTLTTLQKQQLYRSLWPTVFQNHAPIWESYHAGYIGRSEIIVHGTTIDPDYFSEQSFFPLVPTMGCLSTYESWNIFNGRLLKSQQLQLTNTFFADGIMNGLLVVLEKDNVQQPVSLSEIESIVNMYENKYHMCK